VRSVLAVTFAAWASMAAAQAPSMEEPPPSAFGPDPTIIQITTTFRARIEGLADPRDVATTAAQDAARRSLYNMAANECIVLAQFWKAECRLRSFYVDETVANIVGPPEVLPHVPSMFGRAVYELRPSGR
jgi:hypothetical protein